MDILKKAIGSGMGILIAGATGAGKATLSRKLLAESGTALNGDRIFFTGLVDTPELAFSLFGAGSCQVPCVAMIHAGSAEEAHRRLAALVLHGWRPPLSGDTSMPTLDETLLQVRRLFPVVAFLPGRDALGTATFEPQITVAD